MKKNFEILRYQARPADNILRGYEQLDSRVGARSCPPAAGRVGGNLFHTRKACNKDLPADTWKTISIPLTHVASQMKRGHRQDGSPDLDVLTAYLIHASTMGQDAGLVFDRMSITNRHE